jgi:hypothetical protein
MPIAELIDRVVALLSIVASKSNKNAEEANLLKQELLHLKGWAYPHLTTKDLVQATRCGKCKFYKRYKRKGDPKAAPFYACSITKIKRSEDFYCAEGKSR